MSKFTISATQTGTKTSARGPTLIVGNPDILITEVGVESTVAASSTVALRKFTAAGTAGTGITAIIWDDDGQAPAASGSQVPSTDHTLTTGNLRTSHLPAAIGGGVIWTFDPPLRVRGGSGDGITITLPSGTDQVINFYIDWEE